MAPGERTLRLAELAGALAVLAAPLLYIDRFAGDAGIHLAFAERAALGAPFEFNPGEPVPGVTSPGYMWLLAGFARLFGLAPLPLFAKGIGLLSWWACVWLFWRLALRLVGDRAFALAAALALGLMPGSFYNATLGMENGLFALAALGVAALAAEGRLLGPLPARTGRADAAIALLIGAAFWLRPEAALVGALWFPARLLAVRAARGSALRVLAAAGLCLAVAAALLLVHQHYTGAWLPASGRARMVTGMRGANLVASVLRVSPEFALRLLVYAPLPLLACAFPWSARAARPLGLPEESRRVLLWLLGIFAAGFVAYSCVLGTAHLARYVLYLWPGLILAAATGGRRLWQAASSRPRLRLAGAAFLGAGLAGVYAFEAMQRLSLSETGAVMRYVRAPAARAAYSERWLAALDHPRMRPVVVALQEIQVRYRVDERFVIRSIDGRTDPRFLDFVHGDWVDFEGYLRAMRVDFVADPPAGEAGE